MYEKLMNLFPDMPIRGFAIWQNGEEILCKNEKIVNDIADILDGMGYTAVTGQYEPNTGVNDGLDGYYYVSV